MTSGIKSRVDQAKVVWYQWKYDTQDSTGVFDLVSPSSINLSFLSETEKFDISDHISAVSFTKSMGEAAGSFSITLQNTIDWRRYVKPGEWLTIYMSSEGDLPPPSQYVDQASQANTNSALSAAKKASTVSIPGIKNNQNVPSLPKPNADLSKLGSKLRAICLIERVAIQSSVDSRGTKEITYIVTGKDFGVCLEETDLWFNFFYFQRGVYEQISRGNIGIGVRKLGSLMNTFFDAFFRPQEIFKGATSPYINNIVDNLKQWLLPEALLADIGAKVSGTPFFGNIENLKEFHETFFENNLADPLAGLEGTAWEKLREMCQPEFHELFTEVEDDGTPRVLFRPIPWAINKDRYPNTGKHIMSYKDLAAQPAGLGLPDLTSFAGAASFAGQVNSASTAAGNFFADPVGAASSALTNQNFRKNHSVNVSETDVLSFDLGPDFHSRYNHFYVDVTSQASPQFSSIHALGTQQKIALNFPFKNDPSIKRHGLRKRHMKIKSFLTDSGTLQAGVFKDDPNLQFVLECNEIQRDYWGQSGDFFSGTFNILGVPQIKLGKVLVTDNTIQGCQNMVFYIENYTDSFNVDERGIGTWTQSVGVTRGIEKEDLENRSGTKERQEIESVGNLVTNGRAK